MLYSNFDTIHFPNLLKEFMENGTLIRAHVPLPLARLLTPMRQLVAAAQ